MKSKVTDKITTIILLAISIVGMAIICFTIRSNDIWYDEVFSMDFASRSFGQIVALTGADVHPPLYYFYLKVVIGLGRLIAPGVGAVIWGKVASTIPLLVLLVLSLTVIRKDFGIGAASFFALLVTVMPNLAAYYVEIRMYAFALMLMTGAYIFANKIVKSADDLDILDFVFFALFGILGAYTQYFVCVAVVGLYVAVGLYFLISKKYRKLIPLGICAGASVICYLPWIPYFANQFGTVSQSYWIEPLTIKSIFGCIKFIYLPSIGLGTKGYIVAGLMIAASLAVLVFFLLGKPSKEALFTGLAGIVTLIFTVLVGFIVSVLGRPIFVYRYMIPILGIYFLGLSYMAYETFKDRKVYLYLVIAVFIIGGHYSMSSFRYEENLKPAKMEEAEKVLAGLPADAQIVTNFDQICTLMDYYLPGKTIYLYEDETDPIVQLMYGNDGQYISEDELVKKVKEDGNVYFFGSFNSREDLLKEWETFDITNEMYFDSAMIERYYFNIYKLN